jgi:hypothetical protein
VLGGRKKDSFPPLPPLFFFSFFVAGALASERLPLWREGERRGEGRRQPSCSLHQLQSRACTLAWCAGALPSRPSRSLGVEREKRERDREERESERESGGSSTERRGAPLSRLSLRDAHPPFLASSLAVLFKFIACPTWDMPYGVVRRERRRDSLALGGGRRERGDARRRRAGGRGRAPSPGLAETTHRLPGLPTQLLGRTAT